MLKTVTSTLFARPANTTAYASGDLVANHATAGSVVLPTIGIARVPGGTGRIKRAFLKKSDAGVTNAAFRIHLYRAIPTPTNGDNGAWLTTQSSYLGSYDVTVDKAFADGAAGFSAAADIPFDLGVGAQRVWVVIEARGAYTPASAETFTVSLDVDQD